MSFLSGLFGGGAPKIQFNPSGVSNPTGFNVSPTGSVSESPTLQSNVGGVQNTFAAESRALGGLASTVAPGFSNFRKSGLADITGQFQRARSNLRDTLAQRKVLGSSFGNAQFSQQAADEAKTKADFEAQSYLAELDASNKLIQEQYQAGVQSFATAINQSDIEGEIAAGLVSKNNAASASVATAQAELDAKAAQGAGSFLGTILGAGPNSIAGNIFSGIGNIFSGGADAAAGGLDFSGITDEMLMAGTALL